MSFMNSLNTGASGLQGFQSKMDVIGNNIANVNTTGFKSGRVSFSEMMTQNLTRGGQRFNDSPQFTNQLGLGVRVSSIDRDLNQGSIQNTNRPTDLAVEGNSYFMVNNQDQNFLTRAGNFSFNKDGFLVNQQGYRVQGYNADSNGNLISGGATNDLKLNFEDVYKPQATRNINLAGNLNANTSTGKVISQSTAFTEGANLASGDSLLENISQFDGINDGDNINFTITDRDGNESNVSFAFEERIVDNTDPDNPVVVQEGSRLNDFIEFINDQLGDASARLEDGLIIVNSDQFGSSQLALGNFEIEDGTDPTVTTEIENLNFTTTREGADGSKTISSTVYDGLGEAHTVLIELTQSGFGQWNYEARFLNGETISSGETGTLEFDAQGKLVSGNTEIEFNPGNGSSNVTFNVNFSSEGKGLTQFDGNNSANVTSQDGFAQGDLIDFFVDGEGFLVGTYSNGKSKNLGQLALANVSNAEGLTNIGGGLLGLSPASGDLSVDIASNLSGSSVTSGALESSNVDLAKEFTDMIVTQRAYQSNARVIQTADQLLNEAVNLKR